MEGTYQSLAQQVSEAAFSCKRSRFLVAVAGAPGSGKTTIAMEVVKSINSKGPIPQAIAISMDGFHLPRSVLDGLSNREEAYARRGAPWTFDVKGILALVQLLRSSADVTAPFREPIYAPTFDHAMKDPVDRGVVITREISIIVLEGNYLMLNEDDWREISRLVDLRIFVEVDPMEARRRVVKRHGSSGIEMNREDAERRFDQNDAINGTLVRKRLVPPDITVRSVTERARARSRKAEA